MTKDRYVLDRVKTYITNKLDNKEAINGEVLSDLINQWEFDYKVEREITVTCNMELDDVLPFGENYFNETRAVMNVKTKRAIETLDTYDASEKSAQDGAHLICSMQQIFETKLSFH